MRCLVVSCVLVASAAHAGKVGQLVDPDPSQGSLAPSSVRGRLSGTVALLTARYVVPIDAGHADGARSLELPARALVTSATVTADGVPHQLELLDATDASQRFAAIAGEDGTGAPPSAVWITGSAGHVEISFASPRARTIAIALELAAPTCFARDMRYVGLPATWTHLDGALPTRNTEDVFEACGFDPGSEPRVVGFPAGGLADQPSGQRIGVHAGRIALGVDHVAHVELALAANLGSIPRDLATVFVIDASRSMSASALEAQRELVLSYVRGAPLGRIQVVTFARTPRALLPSWSTASVALPRLSRELAALAPRNGSNFDLGLAEAGRWLGRIDGTRRVVLITDEQLAHRLSATPPERWRALLPPDTLVHVVAADPHGAAVVRDDDGVLAPLAKLTEGIAVRVGLVDQHPADATMLLRPIELARIVVKAPGWKAIAPDTTGRACANDTAEQPGTLAEGTSCGWWGQGTAISGPIAIEALVWNHPVTRVVRPDPARGLELARELSALQALDADPQARVDLAARAVNSRWSLFAQWGGHGSYDELSGSSGVISGCACDVGVSSTRSHDIVGLVGIRAPKVELDSQLAAAAAACHLERGRVDVTLELTMLEIVDVQVTATVRSGVTPDERRALEACVTEAAWDLTPMLAQPLAHATYTLALVAAP